MISSDTRWLWVFLFLSPILDMPARARGEVAYLGRAIIPSLQSDRPQGEVGAASQFRVGGFGAIDYSGTGNRYFLVPDRGPDDGESEFACRVHEVEIDVNPQSTPVVEVVWVATRLLRDESNSTLVGSSSAFDAESGSQGRRFDPEGVRVLGERVFLSDEYGPSIAEFDMLGRRRRVFELPDYFRIRVPSSSFNDEISANTIGRIPNRGLEGLALSVDRRRIYGAMQSALIQDAVPSEMGRLYGKHTRIIEIELATGAQRQFAYPLADVKNGVSEILAVDDSKLLVLERDDRAGMEAKYKRIVLIDLDHATDIRSFERLPSDRLPSGYAAVEREDLIDLLDTRFGLAGPDLPEKFEGMTFGPALPDGRRLLLVSVDNDFKVGEPSQILAFAIRAPRLHSFISRTRFSPGPGGR